MDSKEVICSTSADTTCYVLPAPEGRMHREHAPPPQLCLGVRKFRRKFLLKCSVLLQGQELGAVKEGHLYGPSQLVASQEARESETRREDGRLSECVCSA